MESNQVVAGQVPDENDIERLFPKCPPKQAPTLAAGKRSLDNNSLDRDAQRVTRRQTRPKHSRRELGARRNKLTSSNRKDELTNNNNANGGNHYTKNSITNNSTSNNNNANSSESSDDNRTHRSRLKRSNSHSGQNSSNSGLKQNPSGSSTSLSNSSQLPSSTRRSSKYTASQNLLQHLDRSQSTSSYSNQNISQINERQQLKPQARASKQESRVSGIVKSSSSFAFVNEPSTPISSSQQLSAASSAANSPVIQKDDGSNKMNDNSKSDLLFDQNVPTQSVGPKGCGKSILRNSSKRDNLKPQALGNSVDEAAVARGGNNCHATKEAATGKATTTDGLLEMEAAKSELTNSLLSKIDKHNSRCRSIESASASYTGIVRSQIEPSCVVLTSEPADSAHCATALKADNVRQSSDSPTTPADWVSRDERNSILPSTKQNSASISSEKLIRISDETSSSLLIDATNSSVDNFEAPTNTNNKRRSQKDRSLRSETNDPSGRNNDEKYINLFVYDSATNQTLQRNQVLVSSPESPLSPPPINSSQKATEPTSDSNQIKGTESYKQALVETTSDYEQTSSLFQKNISSNINFGTADTRFEPIPTKIDVERVKLNDNFSDETKFYQSQSPIRPPFRQKAPNKSNNTSNTINCSNIVSVQHRESQQLLVTGLNDDDDNNDGANLVRNDASTEELCSSGDSSSNRTVKIPSNKEQKHPSIPSLHQNSSNNGSNLRPTSSHRSSSLPAVVGTLQTVDESAENNLDEQEVTGCDNKVRSVDDKKTQGEPTNGAMPANQSNLVASKKAFVPPGHPQRIRHQPVSCSSTATTSGSLSGVSSTRENVQSNNSNIEDNSIQTTRKVVDIIDVDGVQRECYSLSKNNNKTDGPRVKFNEENLVSVSGNEHSGHRVALDCFATMDQKQHSTLAALLPSPPYAKQPPELSSVQQQVSTMIQVENCESKLETTTRYDSVIDPEEKDISLNLNKISLANSYGNDITEETNRVETEDIAATQSIPQENYQHQKSHHLSEKHDYLSAPILQQLQQHNMEASSVLSNLQHHKLPNEASHYSIVRSNINNDLGDVVPPRSSNIQFNTLSDGDSGPDDEPQRSGNNIILSGSTRHPSYTLVAKKCDLSSAATSSDSKNSPSSNLGGLQQQQQLSFSKAGAVNNLDDDLMPTTKTALIFPRLDEGLSSEAESGDDEIDDDDECAVDADVEADDDDDDEVDDDDDDDEDDEDIDEDDNDTLPMGGNGSQSLPPGSVDCFLRSQQQHQLKPTNTLISSLQQQQQSQAHNSSIGLGLSPPDQSNLQLVKAPGSAYGGYMNQDHLEHNDLKSMTNYSNQNGQTSNYWMSVANQQQANLSSQPTSSQQFNPRTNHNNHINSTTSPMSKQNSRDEAKATNRLSSDTDNETDRLLGSQRNDQMKALTNSDNVTSVSGSNNVSDLQQSSSAMKQNASSKEVLIEGVLFNVKYLGSTHSDCEGRSEKEDRIHQAEMAVQEVKFRNGDSQSATEVQLFISTEKIIVLEDKHRQIMMDHSLRTISYIADIGDAIVLIVRKKTSSSEATNDLGRPINKISCHVFESRESHTITKAISHAFQVAYAELLKANGGESGNYPHRSNDSSIPPDYQEVLNSQEMSTDELEMFSRQDNQRQVFVPKEKGEILGLSIVESGWGSVLPTVVIANLKQDGPAYRCKRLSVGDQIIKVGGISLVGLPLAECQEILRKTKNSTNVIFQVVPCPITVEVKIKRPDTKYQLGFSVQNGVICSLLRGGIAERGGVRVGHRIMSINGTTVVGVPHEKIVTLLASSVGEIRMKTCLTSLYRLMLGEENPVHF